MTHDSSASGALPVVVSEPEGLSDETLVQLQRLGPVTVGPFDRHDLLRAVPSAAVLMVRLKHSIDRELLTAAPHLKLVISATTGVNHIDLEACKERGIEVICLRGERAFLATITSTAELALVLLLNVVRNVVPAHADVMAGRWRRDQFRGLSLRELTLGVVGLGRLGCVMAGYAKALGMRIIGSDPGPLSVPDFVERVDLDTLVSSSDAISLHATHDAGKPPLLGARELAMLKPGAFLVNTARGELVDEAALLAGLESGRIGGYGTDVLSNETAWTDFSDHPLVRYARSHSNVVITPHIGGATLDGLHRAEAFVVNRALQHFGLEQRQSR